MSNQSQFVERKVDIANGTINYQQWGKVSTSTPILFLHGWGISAEPYYEVLSILSQQYQVIAPDLPGFSGSGSCGVIESYEQYAEILLSFLAALKIETVHLVGHSLGGGISVTIAALAPQTVQSLVLVDSTGIPSGSVFEVLLRRAIEMPLQLSPAKLYLQFFDIPRAFAPNLLFNIQNVIQALLLSLETDLSELISKVQAPCLLLWSTKDLTTPLTAAEVFYRTIKNSKLVAVEEGYHEWGLLYPEKFTAEISSFIQNAAVEHV